MALLSNHKSLDRNNCTFKNDHQRALKNSESIPKNSGYQKLFFGRLLMSYDSVIANGCCGDLLLSQELQIIRTYTQLPKNYDLFTISEVFLVFKYRLCCNFFAKTAKDIRQYVFGNVSYQPQENYFCHYHIPFVANADITLLFSHTT